MFRKLEEFSGKKFKRERMIRVLNENKMDEKKFIQKNE